ncbi:phospholipase D-like domain-containing protein [Psychroflexus tropicus]|uniref:phospholipase D-like domain-containing protein n=1 Tax=Psychroflexus tropicus TaxID=197345 RepID=UPI00036F74D6|nr:phospholipase D-like domain-containing protein [Psychroflexus tropicus]
MKIIQPYQITSEILNLINDSEEYLVLVSPYVNFKNWDRIMTDLSNARNRGVNIQFYIRLDSNNYKSWEQIESLNIKPKLIKNLHAKLYFNEKAGIVTSMNLLTSSNLSAIEFGSICDSEDEMVELKMFVKKVLEPNVELTKPNPDEIYLSKERFNVILSNSLSNRFERSVNAYWKNGSLNFNVGNQYYLDIDKGNNIVYVIGITSNLETENFQSFLEKNKFSEFVAESSQNNIRIRSEFRLSNSNLNYITVKEKKKLINVICDFVEKLAEHKEECYRKKKSL